MTNSTEPSPLAEANPASLDELFSRDPLSLSNNDIARGVEALRAQRANWKIAEAQGKTKAPKAKKAKPDSAEVGSLDDIGL